MNIQCICLVWMCVFSSLGYLSRRNCKVILYFVFNFLRNCLTVFQRGCIILYFHLQHMRVSTFPHPPLHLLFSWIITTLADGKCITLCFYFHSPNNWWYWAFFLSIFWSFVYLLWRNINRKMIWPFFSWIEFYCQVMNSLFSIQVPC